MNYSALMAEISQSQYSGMTDADIAAALMAPTASTYRPVPIVDLSATAYATGLVVRLHQAIRSTETPAELAAVSAALLGMLNAPFTTVDLLSEGGTPDAAATIMLDALENAGMLSGPERATIEALAVVPGLSRSQILGLGSVTADDIAAARVWQADQDAEIARLAVYGAHRTRLHDGYLSALGWLQVRLDGGYSAPEWADVLARL